MRVLGLFLLMATLPLAAGAKEWPERKVVFGPVETADQRAFVEVWLPGLSGEQLGAWQARLEQGQVRWAEVDIDSNGTPERLVMSTALQDCNQYGCQTYMAWFSLGRWKKVLAAHMPEDDVAIPGSRRGLTHHVRHGTFVTGFTLLDGEDVTFRPLADAAERAFARDWLVRHSKSDEPPAFWDKALAEDRIRIATIDLDDDGVAERLLMIVDPGWCGTAGCQTYILKHKGKRWVVVTGTNMHDTVRVLAEKRNGWHRLITGMDLLSFDKRGHAVESVVLATGEVAR